MRKFVAGVCCLIVGLQVLVGVPLAVCLIFYGLTQGGPIAVQVQPASFDPCTIPPPNYPTAAFPSPPSIPASFDGPPAPVGHTDERASAAISEARERNGNPLAGTFVAAEAPPKTIASESSLASPSQTPDSRPALPASEPADSPSAISVVESKPCGDSLASLQSAIQQLYAHATAYEDQGNFGRADQVRKLARELREEVELIKLHESASRASLENTHAGPPSTSADLSPKPAY